MTDEKKVLEKPKSEKPVITNPDGLTPEQQNALLKTDVNRLSAAEQKEFIIALCAHLDLNPFLKPFDFIRDGNKVVLYANASCADQIRQKQRLSVEPFTKNVIELPVEATEFVEEQIPVPGKPGEFKTERRKTQVVKMRPAVYEITFKVSDPVDPKNPDIPPRVTYDVGTYPIVGTPEYVADAVKKAWTAGQRRATLGHYGIAFPDVSEEVGMRPKQAPLEEPRQISAPKRAPVDPPEKSVKAPTPPPVQPMKNGNGVSKASLEGAVQDTKAKPPAVPPEKL